MRSLRSNGADDRPFLYDLSVGDLRRPHELADEVAKDPDEDHHHR